MDEASLNALLGQMLDLLKAAGCTYGEAKFLMMKLQAALENLSGGKTL